MNILRVFFFLLPIFIHAQKTYNFDYLLDYEQTHFRADTIKQNRIFLTNSKDNSYYAVISELDSLHYELMLHDRNKLHSKVKVKKAEFLNNEDINIDCNQVLAYENRYKFQVKNYEFISLKDTLFNRKYCKVYKLKSTLKKKKIIRKKIGSHIYIIDSSTSFHLPFLEHDTEYEEWLKERSLPNGIFLKKILLNYKDEISTIQELKELKKVEININILGNCDHVKIKVTIDGKGF
ncbi:hypothetical protein [Winogradskyella pulchriflava]|uniref:GLPGLI family protein n=1 Tax=Winogradskyella pulchriflava TaxID=1110688 RepID=A0ABV6Q592_9FLAO